MLRSLRVDPRSRFALDVGCGGGVLTEDLSRLGFTAFGLDPSGPSLAVARDHALSGGLSISYIRGTGEAIPFAPASFDVVFCCDVLEHVRDLRAVVAEISRVLKPGGMFFYDTLNRNLYSLLVVIKVAQEWRRFAFMPPTASTCGICSSSPGR